MMLESGGARPRQISRDELIGMFLDTRRYWREWLDRSTYTGRWREAVTRSAMTLKLMTYGPTGALIAAPTCGCPNKSVVSATGTTGIRGYATHRSRSTRCSASVTPTKPKRSSPG